MKLSHLIKKLKSLQKANEDPEVILMPNTGADEAYHITEVEKYDNVVLYFEDDY